MRTFRRGAPNFFQISGAGGLSGQKIVLQFLGGWGRGSPPPPPKEAPFPDQGGAQPTVAPPGGSKHTCPKKWRKKKILF